MKKIEYKYLVANPLGVFLIRCKTMEQVEEFVDAHLKRCKEAYDVLYKVPIIKKDYQVRDLTEIPIFDHWKNNS